MSIQSIALRSDQVASLQDRGLMHFSRPGLVSIYLKETLRQNRIRERNYERGLNYKGKPRKRPYQWLIGLTPEQKHQRRKEQQRNAMNKKRGKI